MLSGRLVFLVYVEYSPPPPCAHVLFTHRHRAAGYRGGACKLWGGRRHAEVARH